VSEGLQTSCPHCHANFLVKEEQLRSAEGRVRCGVCLRVFDGRNGEAEFVSPVVNSENEETPLLNFSIRPMEHAELPAPPTPAPAGLKLLLLTLFLLLAAQIAHYQYGLGQPKASSLRISQLIVRAHPEQERALRMDAILHNAGDEAAAYPALFLYIDNRYGERRAQRLFLPAEYLPPRIEDASQFPGRTRLQISLDLRDPGQGSVNYGLALQDLPEPQN
jgi:predicted Zn finger-like uncharacterized protein